MKKNAGTRNNFQQKVIKQRKYEYQKTEDGILMYNIIDFLVGK